MIFVPLLGFTLGAQMIAGDRESGTLVYLLSHPLSKKQIFLGKFAGVVWALGLALTAGFGVAAFGMAASGAGQILSFVVLWLMSLLFIVICVAMGMLVSVLSDNRGKAIGTAVMGWLLFTVFSDLGLMGTAFMLRLRSEGVVGLTLLNPVEVFKIAVVRILASNLEVLGAGGLYMDLVFGKWLPVLLIGWLTVVTLGCLGGAYWVFSQQEEF
jgi:Cu-processing system permease protein